MALPWGGGGCTWDPGGPPTNGMSKGYLLKKNGMKKRYTCICLFRDNSPAAKDPVPTCALVCMTLFGNGYVPVQKRAGDQYQCNERDKDSDY